MYFVVVARQREGFVDGGTREQSLHPSLPPFSLLLSPSTLSPGKHCFVEPRRVSRGPLAARSPEISENRRSSFSSSLFVRRFELARNVRLHLHHQSSSSYRTNERTNERTRSFITDGRFNFPAEFIRPIYTPIGRNELRGFVQIHHRDPLSFFRFDRSMIGRCKKEE